MTQDSGNKRAKNSTHFVRLKVFTVRGKDLKDRMTLYDLQFDSESERAKNSNHMI